MDSQTDARKLILNFVKDNGTIPALQFIQEDPGGVVIEQQLGLINYTYRVISNDGKSSVIIKHGKDCIKGISTDRVTLDRQVLEYNCLNLMESIAPGSAPKPYCLDRNHNIIAMEDLSDWELFMDPHQEGRVDIGIADSLGHLLAKMHQRTARSNVSSQRWQELSMFRQAEMKTTMGKFLWENPYIETHKNNKIPAQALESYRQYVTELKDLGYDKKMAKLYWEEKSFIHADCHWTSIFVKNGKAALFDFEFGFLSHPAQNVGFIVMDYFLCFVLAKSKAEIQNGNILSLTDLQSQFRQAVKTFLDVYLADHSGLSEDSKKELLSHTALFAGGISFAKSIFGPHEELAYFTEPVNLQLFYTGFRMMRNHGDLQTVETLLNTLFNE